MKVFPIAGKNYKLPNELNDFQKKMYVHLINWKWKYITKAVGFNGKIEYDAILPDSYTATFPMLYPDIIPAFKNHQSRFSFRIHKYFNHMASSQAANVNLFLPILIHPDASEILKQLKPDLKTLAKSELDNGFQIEFCDKPDGNLKDKTDVSGTDSDIAIAYYNKDDELCLWLIEHKLTEKEFTECGGFKSRGRKTKHDCSKNFTDILSKKETCYYHDVKKFEYWNITDANKSFFVNHGKFTECPFQKGMNQLWRNMLLALSVENDSRQPYKHVYFSVVRHPGNTHLNKSIVQFIDLIDKNPKFSAFTSVDLINAAISRPNPVIGKWIEWYKELYML